MQRLQPEQSLEASVVLQHLQSQIQLCLRRFSSLQCVQTEQGPNVKRSVLHQITRFG